MEWSTPKQGGPMTTLLASADALSGKLAVLLRLNQLNHFYIDFVSIFLIFISKKEAVIRVFGIGVHYRD